jgi:transposase InsO family protein
MMHRCVSEPAQPVTCNPYIHFNNTLLRGPVESGQKKELVNRRSWPSRLELQSAVFEYIEAFYNRERRHSTLGMRSPAAYEQLRLSPLGG